MCRVHICAEAPARHLRHLLGTFEISNTLDTEGDLDKRDSAEEICTAEFHVISHVKSRHCLRLSAPCGQSQIRACVSAVELGEAFPEAQAGGRAPNINDLWEAADPIGPYIITALRARELHRRDVNYIVRDGEVKIVNPSTGRVMPSSRWTDDLHQVWTAFIREVCLT